MAVSSLTKHRQVTDVNLVPEKVIFFLLSRAAVSVRVSHDSYKRYVMSSDLSLVHLIVGAGSPTELQGRRTSFIQGVVTVPPKDRILAGTAHRDNLIKLDSLTKR